MSSRNDQTPVTDAPPHVALGTALSHLSSTMNKLVEQTIEAVTARGIDAYELAPLMKLRDAVRALDDIATDGKSPGAGISPPAANPQPESSYDQHGQHNGEGRGDTVEASEAVLARASAVIDIMVQGGDNPEHAAQMLARQLLVVGIKLPETGGDARAWKRLFNWRNHLIHHKRTGAAWQAYCAFKEELAEIPPDERLRRAVGEKLWDRRHEQVSSQATA